MHSEFWILETMVSCLCHVRAKCAGVLFVSLAATAISQAQFDSQFQERAMEHVRSLTGLGNRVAGSDGELKAIRYIQKQFQQMGLPVAVEPFEFRTFVMENATLSTRGESVNVVRVIFDPYSGITHMRGDVRFVTPDAVEDWSEFSKLDLQNKLVVTREPSNPFRLNRKKPRAILFVPASDFERMQKLNPTIAKVQIVGRVVRAHSANVVASLSAKDRKTDEVIVSAHLDSVRVQGADDNASGVAVLIELARYFQNHRTQAPFALKFVATGGEEEGLLGAKAYLGRHSDELRDCALVFNMDSVGGNGEMHVDMRDGVQGIAGKAVNQLPSDMIKNASSDVDSKWMYIPQNAVASSNVPEWLQTILNSTGETLQIPFIPSRDMGSDHQVFAQAGIVSTNIEISGGRIHSMEDVPGQIAPASLEKAARFVVGVLSKLPTE